MISFGKIFPVLMSTALLSVSVNHAVMAADKAVDAPNGVVPLEITADKALEWNQKAKNYVARGHAMAKQGDLSVTGDVLTATYKGENGSTSDLNEVKAEGHVQMKSGVDSATGDVAIFDLTKDVITLSGSEEQRSKVINASGKNDEQNTLEADKVVVYLKDRKLDHAEATGSVVITLPNGSEAMSDKAVYKQAENLVILSGHVKIKQGTNWLEGEKAEMNLTTRVSKMTNEGNVPVRGVFYPSSSKANSGK